MSTFTFVVLIVCMITLIITNLASISVLSFKKKFVIKAFFLGFLSYLIARGFILPFSSILLMKAFPEASTLINILLLSFGCVYVKKVVYHFSFSRNAPCTHYICAGVGEAFLEIMLSITPIFMNAVSYAFKLRNDSMYEFFSLSYSVPEIDAIISTFLDVPISYYVYLLSSVFVIYFIHVFTASQLQKKTNPLRLILICIALYSLNTVLPSYGHSLYIGIVFVLGCALILYWYRTKPIHKAIFKK